jgi:hypothetical protein
MRLFAHIGLLLAGTAMATQAVATPLEAGPNNTFSADNAVAASSLDDYRGGFMTDAGIAVSLGLERIVTINGNVAEHTQLNLGDLGSLTSGQTRLAADAAGQLRLIQNGGGRFDVQMGGGVLGGTVIQNSLNDQLINNQTIINASVNARGLLQAMNFQSSLQNALTTAAATR